MSSRLQVAALAFLLAVMGFFVVWYKVVYLNIPLMPHAKQSLFTISAEISFKGDKAPANISMALPSSQEGIRIISQESESGDFGYTISYTAEGERAQWAKRELDGDRKIFYKITVSPEPYYLVKPEKKMSVSKESTAVMQPNIEEQLSLWEESDRAAALNLLNDVRARSSDAITFTAELIQQFNAKEPIESVSILLNMKDQNKISLITTLLTYEKIVYRKVRGIFLEDGQKGRRLISMLEVMVNERWELFDYKEGHTIKPDHFFVWQRGHEALFKTQGVLKPKLRFAVTETQVPVISTIKQNTFASNSGFLNFSLFTLPSSQQNAFKQILLVPMGVLVVVVLRILVGIRTMGTFMPVLFALTFIQTTLLSGLIMFFLIVFSGLFIRFYLSKLRLLLVARISAVIIVVIGIMSAMSIVSYKLGISQVLTVTFFPMIILSWTIERMSILWEEEGGREVFVQGGGSLIAAVLAYFAMNNETVAYLFFSFPELLLVVLAIIILIGRYTGYRLTELFRFAPLGR